MTEIRNTTFQPLSFHLAGDTGGIHLGPRERVIIESDRVSRGIRKAAARGFVVLTDITRSTQPDLRAERPVTEHTPASRQRKRKG